MSAPESTGWVKVHRSVWGTDVFAGDAMSRREAWLWLVSAVAFTDTEDVGRGQIRTSLGGLAEVFGWDRARVQRWLQSLAGAGMIADVADGSGRLIEVSKYSEFQAASAPVAETQDQAARYTPRYTCRAAGRKLYIACARACCLVRTDQE